MSKVSGGTVPTCCTVCQTPFPSATARFCSECGNPRLSLQMKKCLLCNLLIPDVPQCMQCFAPQDPQMFQKMPLRYCVNSECRAYLLLSLSVCYRCNQQQPPVQMPYSLPQSEQMPVSFFSSPNYYQTTMAHNQQLVDAQSNIGNWGYQPYHVTVPGLYTPPALHDGTPYSYQSIHNAGSLMDSQSMINDGSLTNTSFPESMSSYTNATSIMHQLSGGNLLGKRSKSDNVEHHTAKQSQSTLFELPKAMVSNPSQHGITLPNHAHSSTNIVLDAKNDSKCDSSTSDYSSSQNIAVYQKKIDNNSPSQVNVVSSSQTSADTSSSQASADVFLSLTTADASSSQTSADASSSQNSADVSLSLTTTDASSKTNADAFSSQISADTSSSQNSADASSSQTSADVSLSLTTADASSKTIADASSSPLSLTTADASSRINADAYKTNADAFSSSSSQTSADASSSQTRADASSKTNADASSSPLSLTTADASKTNADAFSSSSSQTSADASSSQTRADVSLTTITVSFSNISTNASTETSADVSLTTAAASSNTSADASSNTSADASKTSTDASSKTSTDASSKTSTDASSKTSTDASSKTSTDASAKTGTDASSKTSTDASSQAIANVSLPQTSADASQSQTSVDAQTSIDPFHEYHTPPSSPKLAFNVESNFDITEENSDQKMERKEKEKEKKPVDNRPVFLEESLPALQGSPDQMTKIVFHALLPPHFWNWDDKSAVYIKFSHKGLGCWKHDFGPMQLVRNIDNDLIELEYPLIINCVTLSDNIQYKYCVYTNATAKVMNAHFEYINCNVHGITPEFANRVLKVSVNGHHQTFQQYDTIIYPLISNLKLEEEKGWFKSALTSFKERMPSLPWQRKTINQNDTPDENECEKQKSYPMTDTHDVRKRCLQVYLENHIKVLQTGIMSMQANNLVTSLSDVYNCLYNIWMQDGNPNRNTSPKHWKPPHNLKEELKVLILEAAKNLSINDKSCHSCDETTSCDTVVGATLIVCCLQKLEIKEIRHEALSSLLNQFILYPNVAKQLCLQYSAVRALLESSKDLRDLFLSGAKSYCERLLGVQAAPNYLVTIWRLICLIHLIADQKIFQAPYKFPPERWFPSDQSSIHNLLKKVRDTFCNCQPECFKEMYNSLNPYFKLDPPLVPIFIACCPETAYQYLFTVAEPCYSISRIAFILFKNTENVKKHVSKWLLMVSENLAQHCENKMEMQRVAKASEQLMTSILKNQNYYTCVELLHCISLFLQVHSLFTSTTDDLNKSWKQKLIFYIKNYVSKNIGGEQFGRKVYRSSFLYDTWELEMPKEEFEMWDSLQSIQCSGKIKKDWDDAMKEVLFSRIEKLPSLDWKLEVLTRAEGRDSTKPLVMELIVNEVVHSLHNIIVKKPGHTISAESRKKLEQSKNISSLLVNVLKKKYPNFNPSDLTIKDILEWDLWPIFMRMYVRSRFLQEAGLTFSDQEICHAAYDIFMGIYSSVEDGSVQISVLHLLNEKLYDMEKLCEAVTIQEGGSSLSAHVSYDKFSNFISIRLKEYKTFILLQGQLSTLVQQLQFVNIPGMAEIKANLSRDISMQPISSLCSLSDDQFSIPCFQNAAPLFPILPKITILFQMHQSTTFQKFWNAQIKKFQDKLLKIDDVAEEIWETAFRDCCQYLENLKNRTVKLVVVDEILDQYTNNVATLEAELDALEKGICKCSNIPSDPSWIGPCVHRMQEYRSLRQHANVARAILKLKETLGLTGNFAVIEKLAAQFEQTVQDQCLQFIDDNLIKTGEFLHGISSDQSKLQCLEMFSKCRELINWIRIETKDVHDLQHFVTIALATASGGEDDYTRDALSHLRAVGSGFATLIYQLPTTTGYKELEERCTSLWESLAHDLNLPKKLNECNKRIEWYKSVKEMQGSVEKSSFGQIDNIKKYGYYTVGSGAEEASTMLSQLIQLDLIKQDKSLAQQKYTLDELKDLRSKLVLITGDSEESADVDHFLNVFNKVCHIAEVLVQLQQHGHSHYVGWILRFPCNHSGIVDGLTKLLKSMTNDLEVWQRMVDETREHFYCLNYYTTQQLLMLRKELAQLADPSDMKPEILALLESISRNVNAELVVSLIKGIYDETEMEEEKQELLEDHAITWESNQTSDEVHGTLVEHLFSSSLSAPQPQLEECILTPKHKEILANLKTAYGFSEKLILLAFERTSALHDGPICEEDIEQWCSENQDNFEFFDDEEAHDEIETDEDEPIEESVEQLSDLSHVPVASESKLEIKIRGVVPVNKDHHIVKDLMLAGYSEKSALEAAKKFPDDIHKAMDYITDNYTDDDDDDNDEKETGGLFSRAVGSFHDQHENQKINEKSDIEIQYHKSTECYFSLKRLAELLNKLNNKSKAHINFVRKLGGVLKEGEPNLIAVALDEIFMTVLSIYMESEDLPLPSYEEVLICNEDTTTEEVTLLWKRAMGDPNHFRIFCLVHAERLSYQVCDKALRSLTQCSQGKTGYKLVIICSDEDPHIVSKLHQYKRPYSTAIYSYQKFSQYLLNHFTSWQKDNGQLLNASDVDPNKSSVRLVTSERAGMGKSLYIQRMEEVLKERMAQSFCVVNVPIHGPKVTSDNIVQLLRKHFQERKDGVQAVLFHLDISPSVLRQIDCAMFSLLVLQGLSDNHGIIWRCHPAHYYVIEVTIMKEEVSFAKSSFALLKLLPTTNCSSPKKVLHALLNNENGDIVVAIDSIEFQSENFQRVCHYLKRHINKQSLDSFCYKGQSFEGTPADSLQILLTHCGVNNPTWSELSHFVTFLGTQLKTCEQSVFCDEKLVGDVMSGLKTFVVKFMMRMSKDFATSSLKGEVSIENQESITTDKLEKLQIDQRKRWEQNYHPYLFFNEDGFSITFVGFNVSHSGDLQDPARNTIIERGVMNQQLLKGLRHNKVNLSENYRTWNKNTLIQKICAVMGLDFEKQHDPDPTYVLTIDNIIKMMAIHMRFRCNIPVVIMGETGCGKTRLIKYMCDLAAQCYREVKTQTDNEQDSEELPLELNKVAKNMIIMKVHGGISEADVVEKVEEAEKHALKNRERYGIDTVLFFDEANTSDAIGLIKEVMCDRCINGRQIKNDIKFIAACNPYKKHTDLMINKLESAGLGFFVKASETEQKLGKIPLRQLVYRVLDLPPSMRPLVYDFGQLSNNTEKDYIHQIVTDRCQNIHQVKGKADVIQAVTNVLVWSQNDMKRRNDECSFVSLRDVERAMIVFDYFCEKKELFSSRVHEKAEKENKQAVDNDITRSLILAVSVCYHARLTSRAEFEEGVVKQFKIPLKLTESNQFCNEIKWCQDVLLDNMKLGDNIARNAALRENVFMIVVCIELRIPLFLVGKPGSSKSLAKSIVSSSMLGRASEKEFMREMKAVHMFSYQCSQLSTPESVIEVFDVAKSFQKKEQDVNNYVSVVVLDEVGLAEDSPNLPLKALHPLLEDGTEGADSSGQIVSREQRVAFIGISNWALDPAKMNRGVMVTRGDPDETELELSARGICSNAENDPVRDRLAPYFRPLSEAYKEICNLQEKLRISFFGLRDFYSLIKMLYWMCKSTSLPLTRPQLKHAVKRNFGGLDLQKIDTYKIFQKHLKDMDYEHDFSDIRDEELKKLLSPDCSPLGLIKKSLQTKDVSWHGENRYLLFLTENYSALQVLNHYLYNEVGLKSVGISKAAKSQRKKSRLEPFVLFGSSFPKDREYTQVCRNINQIKICMDTGRTVILLNLDNLYESLYDLLNQYYIRLGDQRYVDLGLQTHRVKCRVHNDFKLILIAEKSTVYRKFPTPLINRLEKHFVLSQTALSKWQIEVHDKFIEWIEKFSKIMNDNKFSVQDAFIGFQNDTPASIVYQATDQLQAWPTESDDISEERKKAVLTCSKRILLQMASPDALIRLKLTRLDDKREKFLKIYYFEQHHGSIVEFLNHHLNESQHDSAGLLLQVTTHSHILSSIEVDGLCQYFQIKNEHILLQEFDTEMDFSHKIAPFFSNDEDSLLIIQSDSGHIYGDLIACSHYRIEDEREKAKKHTASRTHVLFIIHLPHKYDSTTRSSFVGFQGGNWIYAHIDDIRVATESDVTLDDVQNYPISQLFYSGTFQTNAYETISDSAIEAASKNEDISIVNLESDESGKKSDDKDYAHFEKEITLFENFDNQPEIKLPDTAMDVKIYDLEEFSEEEENYFQTDKSETRPFKVHTQCTRLYNGIQAAVAATVGTNDYHKKSAASKVKLLLRVIPQCPKMPLDSNTFYGALVKHIKGLLEEKEKISKSEWVLEEALSSKKLQSGGTFQNVLKRRLDEVVVPIFSAILLSIDQYSNLSLLDKTSPNYVKQLWITIFNNQDLVEFSYQNYMMNRGIVYHNHGEQTLASDVKFVCQFPFFWLIKGSIDSKLGLVKSSFGKERWIESHTQLCETLMTSPVAMVFDTLPQQHWVELYKFYFEDFIRSIHQVSHVCFNEEYEILGKALDAIISSSVFNHTSFTSYLAAVHVVYQEYQQDVMWFGQLTTHIPGILYQLLEQEYYNCQVFELPLMAVKIAIGPNNLALPLEPEKRKFIPERLVKLQLCQNTIDSILNLRSNSTNERLIALSNEIRLEWQRLRAVQLFIEHVATKCSKNDDRFIEFVQYAKRIDISLSAHCEFTTKESISKVQRVLRVLDKETGRKLKHPPRMQHKIRECCKSFFMEVVSSLCFGQSNPPNSELIEQLLNIVFEENEEKTKEFSFSEKDDSDKVPVMRSFLLQLLLEQSTEIAKHHLSDYFSRTCQLFQYDYKLYLLCVQCLEDSIYKQCNQMLLSDKVVYVSHLFKEQEKLVKNRDVQGINLQYLEGIAVLRYSFTVIAELIHCQFHKENEEIIYSSECQLLINMAKSFCADTTDDSGPGVFLAKQLARQYGVTFLKNVTNNPSMQWIIPKNLRQSNEVGRTQTIDPFVIYKNYNKMRALLFDVVYGEYLDKFDETVKDLPTSDTITLLVVIYQIVTGSNGFANEAKRVTDNIRTGILQSLRKCTGFRKELIWVAQHLIMDTYYGRLEPMTIRPEMNPQNRLLTDLVVHVAIVIQCNNAIGILTPFVQMINNPGELKEMFLPTMPDDPLLMVKGFNRDATSDKSGQFYKCPKGHTYFIGNCGRPYHRGICYICQSPIGGHSGKADDGNELIPETTDNTETGYALGPPNERDTILITERLLSPAACAVIRALMHSSLLWSSCTNEHSIEGILNLIKTGLRPVELSSFFWRHLEHDINMLSVAMGKSKDDACLLLHVLLKEIASRSHEIQQSSFCGLQTRESRKQWEKEFSETFVQPLLLNADMKLNEVISLQLDLSDENEDRDRLFYVIHEKLELDQSSKAIIPQLWSYHSRITLEHLLQVLHPQKDTCPLLHEFLLQEPMLRATQYLPDIVNLQQQMYQLCHRKFDIKDATKLTVGDYINSLGQKKGIHYQNEKNLIERGLISVRKAWKLVKEKLVDYARIQVDVNFLKTVTWNSNTPMSCIIPTFTGDGVCTVVLVDLLVTVHNNYIQRCRSELEKRQNKDIHWRKHEIFVSQVQNCHLLNYENHILSIVLSHCQYSLEYGKGQKVEYDLPALEKHVIDKFIHGKPLILLEIPQVVFRKDVYTAEAFTNIRKNISPQKKLTEKQQADIVNELHSMQHLRECLDVVEIVIGFISSDKTSANTKLKTYIQKVLRMEKRFTSKKAMEYCTLSHVLSLWQTLSIEIAKTLTLGRQEPFDTFSEVLLTELQDDQKGQLIHFLRRIELTEFLNLLYEFIETSVRHYKDQNLSIDWSLKDVLVEKPELVEMLPSDFAVQFPESITVGQAVATWKAIVFYQQKVNVK